MIPQSLKEDSIKAIAKKHSATEAQVVLSWIVALGDTVIVKSSNDERLKSNFTVRLSFPSQITSCFEATDVNAM